MQWKYPKQQAYISVYDKEAADRQLEGRRKHMEDLNVSDAFFHEGKVLVFIDNEQIDKLVKAYHDFLPHR